MNDRFPVRPRAARRTIAWSLLALSAVSGCASVPKDGSQVPLVPSEKTFVLETISPEKAAGFLTEMGLGEVSGSTEPNTLPVTGPPDELDRAGTVLSLVDTNDLYVVKALLPASKARALPSNEQIARIIGTVALGTFAEPPDPNAPARGLIDIQGPSVWAIVPARVWPHVRAIVMLGPNAARYQRDYVADETEPLPMPREAVPESDTPTTAKASAAAQSDHPRRAEARPEQQEPAEPNAVKPPPSAAEAKIVPVPQPTADPKATPPEPVQGILHLQPEADEAATPTPVRPAVPLDNGDDVIELSLPEKINLVQLVDLVGGYLHLDCIYDAEKLSSHEVTLKLHSKLQSEIRVKDLYTLLETILKFKGLVMTRHEGNLVTIVPADEALDVDPKLVDGGTEALQAGDMVVTRVFRLQHVDVASVSNMLETMKLGVSASPIEESQTLFVTCYAHRMGRIAQLVEMVDRPGKPREFRFRPLKYTVAEVLAQKVLDLAKELRDIPITIAPPAKEAAEDSPRAPRRPKASSEGGVVSPSAEAPVYLDTDERTNRILMIGYADQLATVEELIDTLDVPQQDVRILTVYGIRHLDAAGVMEKLQALGIAMATAQPTRRPARGEQATASSTPTVEKAPGGEPQVVLLEATNSLLVNATQEQHERIRTIIDYVDVSPEDLRRIEIYPIRNVDAFDVMTKLYELAIVDAPGPSRERISRTPTAEARRTERPQPAEAVETPLTTNPQVVVLEGTNSLLVNATDPQHRQLQTILQYIDVPAHDRALPYEVYFLENQDPEKLAEVLDKLVQEAVPDEEAKIVPVRKEAEDRIVFVPDAGTFSLVVCANKKNQEWIADVIKQLDKRRPQVLIDVMLVEINKTEAFSYDLNLIQSLPDLVATSGLTSTLSGSVTSSDIMDRLSSSGRGQFTDYQSNSGDFTGFYGDQHINLLLQAMQSKNYGRILAKPKILVNDNQPGTIKATDTTYVAKRSSIPVKSGSAGTDTTLIETAVEYQSYEAGITLNITPHISQGELLRLDIELTRSDFRETADSEKPPDTTSSELTTTVFVPDGSTIILGGLLKLNQNKGGVKVPLLGDIPVVGGLFRSINNRDTQNKLYVFVKAEIIRPDTIFTRGMADLEAISGRSRSAVEDHEREFQDYQDWPGVKPTAVAPERVLEAQ